MQKNAPSPLAPRKISLTKYVRDAKNAALGMQKTHPLPFGVHSRERGDSGNGIGQVGNDFSYLEDDIMIYGG